MPSPTGSTSAGGHWTNAGPPTPILATSFLLAGLGTVVLGPLLPQLLHEWQLTDQRGGLLLLAKFVGAFVGGATVPTRLRVGILAGHMLAALGFAAFALAHGLGLALPALFLTGLGLGEIIAGTNILAGRLFPAHTGSALALLNFFWSFGAVSTGLLVASLLPHVGWRQPVLALATLYALTGALTLVTAQLGRSVAARPPAETATQAYAPTQPVISTEAPTAQSVISTGAKRSGETPVCHQARTAGRSQSATLTTSLASVYGLLLFLYGGLETCLTAWLTTFSLRFAGGHLLGGQSGFVVLWAALTAGRVLASGLMRRFSESLVQRISLALCLLLIGALTATHTAGTLSLTCVLLGLALAPVFPSTFALLLRHDVQPRLAGMLLAVSGLGAALFPWLMGVVSTHTGSLRFAMAVPALLIPVMVLLTLADSQNGTAFPQNPPHKGEDSTKPAL